MNDASNDESKSLIACIPVKLHPTHPKDQTSCTQEKCPHCHEMMWVSEKKRKLRKRLSIKAYCAICITKMIDPKNDLEIIDLQSKNVNEI